MSINSNGLLKAILSKLHLLKPIKMSKGIINIDHTQLHDRLLQRNTELHPSTVAPTTSMVSILCQDSATD